MPLDLQKIFGDVQDIDEKYLKSLLGALERENLKGFDYLEFKQAVQNLLAMNMEPATAIKSAFATAQTMGLTKEELLRSAEHYIAVLMGEEKKVREAAGRKLEERVSGVSKKKAQLENAIQAAKDRMAALKTELQQLEKDLEKHSAELAALSQKGELEKQKIAEREAAFLKASAHIKEAIAADIEQIRQAL
ncbi:MAG TPA: hypothetical protein ENJ88_05545 [Phaeodactylibacter sp.]|nr:hypothetical protein [Phaeodactylibacter sp.]